MIKKHDTIVTAYAQSCAGPGWGNSPIWVVVRDKLGNLREECIQPNSQTGEMLSLYSISQSVNNAMINAITKKYQK